MRNPTASEPPVLPINLAILDRVYAARSAVLLLNWETRRLLLGLLMPGLPQVYETDVDSGMQAELVLP